MTQIDYDSIAQLYDAYVSANFDFDFFTAELGSVDGPVLELTSGTGRLSVVLAQSGADLTCVDCSVEMLSILAQKFEALKLHADIFCRDICELAFNAKFDLAILPFQSFMEILGEERQCQLLASVFNALKPGGRFVCTMHNPTIRRPKVDGCLRLVGDFPCDDGTLVVSGFERGGDPVVLRLQFFEYFSADGILQWKRLLPMQFEFVEEEQFERMARSVGFTVIDLLGDYSGAPFEPNTSPVMIWRLQKPA